ncbi:MAG: phosphoribosyltransferase family protein [Acidimicrobiia bacterium]|nr:phosphoribosyltransferase family protein [Acidimicrobiia bacterium]
MRYVDRTAAGRSLASHVADAIAATSPTSQEERPLVLGVPRGGVIVAAPVADRIAGELDVALARKIGAPRNPELAIGAVGELGDPFLATEIIGSLGLTDDYVAAATEQARGELVRRAALYRGDRSPPQIAGRVVIVVDDGIATGATLQATLQAVRSQSPAKLVCAVPVGPPSSVADLTSHVDAMVCPLQPRWFRAVGEWYETFGQTSDSEVIAVLGRFA